MEHKQELVENVSALCATMLIQKKRRTIGFEKFRAARSRKPRSVDYRLQTTKADIWKSCFYRLQATFFVVHTLRTDVVVTTKL